MTDIFHPLPAVARYALRLQVPDAAAPARLTGRLEHVVTGRCREFADAAELVAWLVSDLGHAGANATTTAQASVVALPTGLDRTV